MAVTPRNGPKRVYRSYIQMGAGISAVNHGMAQAVNMQTAELRMLGCNLTAGAGVQHMPTIKLSNATTVYALRLATGYACDIEFEITEW